MSRHRLLPCPATLLASLCIATIAAAAPSTTPSNASPSTQRVAHTRDEIIAIMRLVADRQLAANAAAGKPDPGWVRANLYPGILAAYDVTGDKRYLDETKRWAAEEGKWTIPGGPSTRPARGRRFADNEAIGWTYADLARRTGDRSLMRDVERMAAELDGGGGATGRVEWWWCDALNMAPPALTRAYVVSGDASYLALLDRLFWDAANYLYDPDERLFFRDGSFFDKRVDERKVFWSRGNGWVVSGIARVLYDLPADHPTRPRYEALFLELCGRIATLQHADGLWRSNLLSPAQHPNPETSGTAFYTFGMAWGINHGLLDRATFEPVVRRAWDGLVRHVLPDGRLGYVQAIGADPRAATPESTHEYATGAFLLAAEQMLQLDAPSKQQATTRPARAHAMFVPQRLDDFAWENDKVAFRAYGPALQTQDGPQSGIDIWVKRVPVLVQGKWYQSGNYHHDNGQGLDGYKVGSSRGCGGTAVLGDGKAFASGNFTTHRIVETGPDRCVFELDYGPWDVSGTAVRETKRVTLDAGSYFSKVQSTLTFDATRGNTLVVGIGLKLSNVTRTLEQTDHAIATWEPLDGDGNGDLGSAVILADPHRAPLGDQMPVVIDGDLYLRASVASGEPITYYIGGGWSKAGFADADAWLAHVRSTAAGLAKPSR